MSERPPTPTGWSDTDWIKKLQHEEENPLGCLHINQGSFDAAADAYEEEYKMSKRTAMDIADALEVEMPTLKNMDAAVAMLRQQHAEIERLTTDLAESRRKSADLEISLQASRDVALRAYGADVCPNCDTALPKGCEGVFANDHDCMWRKI